MATGTWTATARMGLAVTTACLCATRALAATPTPPLGDVAVAKAFSQCRVLTDGPARLACYDKAADAFEQAQAQGDVVVVDRARVKAVQRQSFGLALPSLNFFSHGTKPETLSRINAQLTGAHVGGDGKWVMVTAENGVWRQTDSDTLPSDPHTGSTMLIRKGTFGSFFCNVDGQAAIRCVRDR